MTDKPERSITYLSEPAPVSMGDAWFEIATLDHFWVRRRFEVLVRLCGKLIPQAKRCAEVGCGKGVLQRQVEDRFGVPVTGFDLNDQALRSNGSRQSPLCCYNIHDRSPDL